MKKALLLLILALLFSIVGCSGGGGDTSEEESGGDNSQEEDGILPLPENTIFSKDVSVTIIRDPKYSSDKISVIADKIYELTGNFAVSSGDDFDEAGNEIVLGNTSRTITAQAFAAYEIKRAEVVDDYEKKEYSTAFLRGYGVYSNGKSVAIIWGEEESEDLALDYFVNNYLNKDLLVLGNGYFDVQFYDGYKYEEKIEAEKREEKFADIAATYGDDVAEAVRDHLSLFDESFYYWLAELYDPGEYDAYGNPLGGGFYYSNSGRDTPGYRIDLESTAQALSFLSNCGMIRSSKDYKEFFPEKMQKEMIAFALSCQSPVDGYFYHPQWGTNVQISRISRDLGWATSILKRFGEIPYWDTPSGVEGKYGAPGTPIPVSALTEPLETSAAVAVSKVIGTSEGKSWTGSEQLSTVSAWESYLVVLTADIRTRSYSIGNTVSSQGAQIKAREKMAIENGELADSDEDGIADEGYIRTFERIFNGHQLENGLWEVCSVEEGTVYYNAINGLMKISGAYNNLGVKLNYAEAALRAAAFMVTYIGESDDGSDWADSKGKKPTGSVDVYNPWVCVGNLLSNISKFSSAEESHALRESVIKANAYEMVTVTTRKAKMFKKADGSAGYTWSTSPANSQGAPVAVPSTVEGDINGGCIALTGIYNNMASALGFGSLKVFDHLDLLEFIERASDNKHVKKDATADFNGDEVGSDAPANVALTMGHGSATVVADPREDESGNVISFTTVSGKGSTMRLEKPNSAVKKGVALEWEMCFTDIKVGSGTAFQIKLGSGYMITLGVTTQGVLTVGDSSSTGLGVKNSFSAKFDAKEWNSFKVEYYVLDAASNSTAAKIYVNGELCFVSDNYYGKESSATPNSDYKTASFYALNATDFTVLFDNVKAYDLVKNYKAETPIYSD